MANISTPKYLWFFILSYTMVLAFANWFDARLVDIQGIITDAGTLIFPLSFLLADIITEVYGYKNTRTAIWCGFLFNILFVAYGQLVIHLPSPPYPNYNHLFNQILDLNVRIIIASFISYFISEPLNSIIVAKLKIKMQGKRMWFRFVLSTIIASGFDSFMFSWIAFWGLIQAKEIWALLLTMWAIKVVIEIIGLPLSTRLARKLKTLEHQDIYDTKTSFTLFSLDQKYSEENNHYK